MSRSPAPLVAPRLQGPVSRRGFIRAVLAWVAGTVLLPRGDAAAAPLPGATAAPGVTPQKESASAAPPLEGRDLVLPETSLDRLTLPLFSQRVGDVFRLQLPAAEWVNLELVEAADLTSRYVQLGVAQAQPVAGECFSLLFRGPHDRPLPQDTYRLAHDSLGEFVLLVVPLFPDQEVRTYEAIFNRLAPLM